MYGKGLVEEVIKTCSLKSSRTRTCRMPWPRCYP